MAATVALLVCAFSPDTIGAERPSFGSQTVSDALAPRPAADAANAPPILIKFLVPNTPERPVPPAGSALAGDTRPRVSLHPPASSNSGVTFILVGLSFASGAILMRRTPHR